VTQDRPSRFPSLFAPEGPSAPGGLIAGSESRGRETILLVEDEPDIRELVAEVLKDRGYTVLEAQDGEDALRVVGDLVTRLLVQHPHLNVLLHVGLHR
jgi:PleD family two-component response regulator